MKVAIYTRVSTDEQTEQNQVDVLEKWATNRGWEIAGRYTDVGSAFQHADQHQLKELMADCSRGKYQQVLIYDLSRLTRQGALELMLLLKQFADNGAPVFSYLDTAINVPGEFQPVLVAFYGVMGKLFSSQLSARTKAGMARAKAQGKHVGRPRIKEKTLVIEDIFSVSEEIPGTRFYFLRCDPLVYPKRVKFGISRDLKQRVGQYRQMMPNVELMGSWRCPNKWEAQAISFVTSQLEGDPIRNSSEFYDIEKWDMAIDILNQWFLSQFSTKEKGLVAAPSFSGMGK